MRQRLLALKKFAIFAFGPGIARRSAEWPRFFCGWCGAVRDVHLWILQDFGCRCILFSIAGSLRWLGHGNAGRRRRFCQDVEGNRSSAQRRPRLLIPRLGGMTCMTETYASTAASTATASARSVIGMRMCLLRGYGRPPSCGPYSRQVDVPTSIYCSSDYLAIADVARIVILGCRGPGASLRKFSWTATERNALPRAGSAAPPYKASPDPRTAPIAAGVKNLAAPPAAGHVNNCYARGMAWR